MGIVSSQLRLYLSLTVLWATSDYTNKANTEAEWYAFWLPTLAMLLPAHLEERHCEALLFPQFSLSLWPSQPDPDPSIDTLHAHVKRLIPDFAISCIRWQPNSHSPCQMSLTGWGIPLLIDIKRSGEPRLHSTKMTLMFARRTWSVVKIAQEQAILQADLLFQTCHQQNEVMLIAASGEFFSVLNYRRQGSDSSDSSLQEIEAAWEIMKATLLQLELEHEEHHAYTLQTEIVQEPDATTAEDLEDGTADCHSWAPFSLCETLALEKCLTMFEHRTLPGNLKGIDGKWSRILRVGDDMGNQRLDAIRQNIDNIVKNPLNFACG